MIESKYTIEYINPEPAKKQEVKTAKSFFRFIFSGIILAGLAFLLINFLPIKTSSSPQKTEKRSIVSTTVQSPKVQSTKKVTKEPTKEDQTPETNEKADTTVSDLTSNTKKSNLENTKPNNKNDHGQKNQVNKQIQSNTEIEKNLVLLTARLLETQKKNQKLASELDAQIMENMELSSLLEDSLYKINKEDKSYIKELKKLESNTVHITKINLQESDDKDINTPKTVLKKLANESDKNSKGVDKTNKKKTNNIKEIIQSPIVDTPEINTNRVDLSTSSQVDAIIASMQDKATPSKSSNDNKRQSIATSNEDTADKIELQKEINHMINDKNTDSVNKYQESLDGIN